MDDGDGDLYRTARHGLPNTRHKFLRSMRPGQLLGPFDIGEDYERIRTPLGRKAEEYERIPSPLRQKAKKWLEKEIPMVYTNFKEGC